MFNLEDFNYKDLFMDRERDEYIEKLVSAREENKKILYELKADVHSQEIINTFNSLCKKYKLSNSNKFLFSSKLCELIDKKFNNEIIWLYLILISDNGLIFSDGSERTEYTNMSLYSYMIHDLNNLYDIFARMADYKEEFDNLFKRLPKEIISDTNAELKDKFKLIQLFLKFIGKEESSLNDILDKNIEYICSILEASSELQKIAPLFCYQVMTKHQSRIFSMQDFSFDINNLWKYKTYQIKKDNGKNFNAMSKSMELFLDLLEYYSKTSDISIELNIYGFYSLSNMWEWYHKYLEYDDDTIVVSPKRLFELRSFSCFDEASLPKSLFKDYEADEKTFYSLPYRSNTLALEKYLTENPDILKIYIATIKKESENSLMELLQNIINNCNLKFKYIDTENTPILYKSVNYILMKLADKYMLELLADKGNSLIASISHINT